MDSKDAAASTLVGPPASGANPSGGAMLQFTKLSLDPGSGNPPVHIRCHAADPAVPVKDAPTAGVAGLSNGLQPQDATKAAEKAALSVPPPGGTMQFRGSLEELFAVMEKATGCVIDLQGAVITSEKQGDSASHAMPTDPVSSEESPRSSATIESMDSGPSLESTPSELLTVLQAAHAATPADKASAGIGSPDRPHTVGLPPRSPLVTPHGSQSELAKLGPRQLQRHASHHPTSHRSKKLQQERKHASRSTPSVPVSLASAYDSRELVSKALSHRSSEVASPAYVLKAQQVTLRNGTLNLPLDRMVLVLKDQDLTIEDVIVTGPGVSWDEPTSFPLLHVEGARVKMTRVAVSSNQSGHGLTLGIGSDVTLTECSFDGNDLSGLLVGGENCRLRAAHCIFSSNLQDGAIVCRGSFAEFDQCTFAENEMLGLEVAFSGAQAVLRGCKFHKNMEHGVSAYSGVSLTMEGCEIKSSHRVGVSVLDETTSIVLRDCSILENRHEGILACQGVKVNAYKCNISANRMGLEASGADTSVTLTQCNISRNSNANVTVNTAALVTLEQSECAESKGKGVAVLHPGSRFHATRSVFSGCATTGVHVSKISTANLEHCVLKNNHISGAHVTDTGSTLVLEHCALSSNQTIGIFANKAGDATLKHCEIAANGSTGAEVRDRQARMRLAHCVVKDNKRVGVYSHSAAVATLVACVLRGNGVKAMLVGGRENVEMGGGIIEYDRATEVDGDIMMRHSGRALIAELGALTQSLSDIED